MGSKQSSCQPPLPPIPRSLEIEHSPPAQKIGMVRIAAHATVTSCGGGKLNE
jgi:hypothetical protein